MRIEISDQALTELVISQLTHLFALEKSAERTIVRLGIAPALEKTEFCFRHTKHKYYVKDGETYFNPFHSAQYSIFLYFLARSVFLTIPEKHVVADKVYYLNKALNGFDLFYEVNMPKIFMLDHPVGSVLGRATYGDYFSFSQNCTVGNSKGIYPSMGENVTMLSGSKVLGDCKIGDNVTFAANTYVLDTDIPSCSLVFGSSPDLTIKSRSKEYFARP